jgi:hypothetical protein
LTDDKKLLNFNIATNISIARIIYEKFSGGYSCKETPVPISNTAVKLATLMILGWSRPGKVSTARVKLKPQCKLGLFYGIHTIV